MIRSELKRVTLLRDEDGYYLRLAYEQEDDNEIKKLVIPKARLHIADTPFINYQEPEYLDIAHNVPPLIINKAQIQISPFVTLPIERTTAYIKGRKAENIDYYTEVIHTKTKEMTIEEIEKALGHKVKIVGEKEIEKACSNCRHLNQLTGGCRLTCKDLEKFEARED